MEMVHTEQHNSASHGMPRHGLVEHSLACTVMGEAALMKEGNRINLQ